MAGVIIQGVTLQYVDTVLDAVSRRVVCVAPLASVTISQGGSPAALYAEEALLTPLDNPVVSDSFGRVFAFAEEGNNYTITVETASGQVGLFTNENLVRSSV